MHLTKTLCRFLLFSQTMTLTSNCDSFDHFVCVKVWSSSDIRAGAFLFDGDDMKKWPAAYVIYNKLVVYGENWLILASTIFLTDPPVWQTDGIDMVATLSRIKSNILVSATKSWQCGHCFKWTRCCTSAKNTVFLWTYNTAFILHRVA